MEKYSDILRRLAKELEEDFVHNVGPVSIELNDLHHELGRVDLSLRMNDQGPPDTGSALSSERNFSPEKRK